MNILKTVFGLGPGDSSPEFQALVVRWNSYLTKLQDRYNEVLKQTDDPMSNVVGNLQWDNVVIHNILNGLRNQTVEQLSKKADEGWAKMESEMYKIGASFGQIAEQRKKVDEFKDLISNEFKMYEVKLYADAARKILDNVRQHISTNKLHMCTQCAAELPINVYSFISVNLKCESCGSVNTYKPDDRIRALEYYVLNHLAEEHAFPVKMKAKYDKNQQKEYFKQYYGFLMEHVPDKKEFYERDMNERMNNPFFALGF